MADYIEGMATALGLLCISATLLVWDLQLKAMQAFSRRAARRHLNRSVSGMAHRLFTIAKAYVGLTVEVDRRLTSAPPAPTIVVANHQSVADIVVLLDAFTSHRLRFVAKHELSRGFPAVSEVLRIQRHALINRSGEYRRAAREMARLGRETEVGISPAVFPEGTRSRDGAVHTFHPGAVRSILSHCESPVPITAVAVDGGQYFTSVGDIARGLSHVTYRARLAGIYHHDGSKAAIAEALREAQASITRIVLGWRAGEQQHR